MPIIKCGEEKCLFNDGTRCTKNYLALFMSDCMCSGYVKLIAAKKKLLANILFVMNDIGLDESYRRLTKGGGGGFWTASENEVVALLRELLAEQKSNHTQRWRIE